MIVTLVDQAVSTGRCSRRPWLPQQYGWRLKLSLVLPSEALSGAQSAAPVISAAVFPVLKLFTHFQALEHSPRNA